MLTLSKHSHFCISGYGETETLILKKNEDTIQASFAHLVRQVLIILNKLDIDMDEFRMFVVHLFPPGHCIPESEKISVIFRAISLHNLWSYTHYDPLKSIVNEFASEDQQAKSLIESYVLQLVGYYATTRLVDFISLCEERKQEVKSITEYDEAYFQTLSLKLGRPVSDKTLKYIHELWEDLASTFLLPSLTAILDAVVTGSMVVIWYVSYSVTKTIVENISEDKAKQFFWDHRIMEVKIDDAVVYQCTSNESIKVYCIMV